MGLNANFNTQVTMREPFDGNLCAAFACQAANDPQFKDMPAQDAIAARAALSGLATGQAVMSMGNAPGLAAAALAGMAINVVPPPTQPAPAVQQDMQLKN